MSKWISVDDELPDFKIPVLTIGVNKSGEWTTPLVACLYKEGFITSYSFCGDRIIKFAVETKPTHWMDLVGPPVE